MLYEVITTSDKQPPIAVACACHQRELVVTLNVVQCRHIVWLDLLLFINCITVNIAVRHTHYDIITFFELIQPPEMRTARKVMPCDDKVARFIRNNFV